MTDDVGSTLRVDVTATNAEGSASSLSAQTAVVTQPTVPLNTAEPLISGSPVEGMTLSTTTGTWAGTSITFAYQWVRCDAGGGLPEGSDCPTIPAATGSGYTLTADDVGRRLRVQVTATNSAGSTAAASNPTDVVTQSTATGPPRNTTEPSISGTPQQGFFLFADIGTWAGATPITFTYQWVRCGAGGGNPDGSNCTFISAATTSSYVPTSDDVGQRLRLRVTATNSLGAQTVASNASAPVLARDHGTAAGAAQHLPAVDLGHAGGRPDALREPRQLDRHAADHLRVPVDAVRRRRRHLGRVGLHGHRGRDELAVRAGDAPTSGSAFVSR